MKTPRTSTGSRKPRRPPNPDAGGTLPNDALPNDALPNDSLPNDSLSNNALPNNALPNDAMPNDALPKVAPPKVARAKRRRATRAAPADSAPVDSAPADSALEVNAVAIKDEEATYQQHYDSALSLWEAGNQKQAVAELEIALAAVPNRVDRWCQLGEFYNVLCSEALLQNDHQEADRLRHKAATALTQAITLSPDFAKAHYLLAEVYWGRDFQMALAELEAAAKYDAQEYGSVLEQARTTVRECSYQLTRMNVIVLGSAQAMQSQRILETEFLFAPCRIGCAVMHSRVSDDQREWAHVWLFESEHPDLNEDVPVAELSISSTGDVSITEGCPANYHALKAQAAGSGVLAGWRGKKGPPASYGSASPAIVEDVGIHVATSESGTALRTELHDQPLPVVAPEKRVLRARSAPASKRRTPDKRRSPAPEPQFDPAKILTEALPPELDTGGVVTPEAIKAQADASYARSRRIIVWTCLSAVLLAAAGWQFFFEKGGAPSTSQEQPAHVGAESTALKAATDVQPEAVGSAAFDPGPVSSETAGFRGSHTSELRSAEPVLMTPPIQSVSPAKPQVRKADPAPMTPPVQALSPAKPQARKADPVPSTRPVQAHSPPPKPQAHKTDRVPAARSAPPHSPPPKAQAQKTDRVQSTRPAQPQSPAKPQVQKTADPKPVAGASAPVETETTQVAVVEPPRQPTRTEVAVVEAKRSVTPAERARERMRSELKQCGEMGVIQRGVCMERTRWKYCHPDGWNKSPEC